MKILVADLLSIDSKLIKMPVIDKLVIDEWDVLVSEIY